MNMNHLWIAAPALTLATALIGCVYEAQDDSSNESALTPAGHVDETTSDSSDELAWQQEQHCNIAATAIRKGEPRVAERPATECFDSFSDAIFAATKGAVRLAPDATPESIDQLPAKDLATLATYLIATEYVAPNWDGFWGTWNVTSSVSCNDVDQLYVSNLAGTGWNDVISSARIYEGCAHAFHYEHRDFGGTRLDCNPAGGANPCKDLGAMNDRTSSIRWTNNPF